MAAAEYPALISLQMYVVLQDVMAIIPHDCSREMRVDRELVGVASSILSAKRLAWQGSVGSYETEVDGRSLPPFTIYDADVDDDWPKAVRSFKPFFHDGEHILDFHSFLDRWQTLY